MKNNQKHVKRILKDIKKKITKYIYIYTNIIKNIKMTLKNNQKQKEVVDHLDGGADTFPTPEVDATCVGSVAVNILPC